MEELKNSLLDRINVKNRVGFKNVLDEQSEVVLERLSEIKDDEILKKIIKDLRDLIENNVNTNDELLLLMIEIREKRDGLNNYSFYDTIFSTKIEVQEKIECLNKTLKATKEFQIDYIHDIYDNRLIPYKDLASDIILDCKYIEQAIKIYNMFSSIEIDEEQVFMPVFLEVAKLMTKVEDEDVLDNMAELAKDENLLNTGCTTKVVKMLTKCKTYEQVNCITYLFDELDIEVIPYAILACKYFLRTKDEVILNNLYSYIKHNLRNGLPISLENIELITNERHDFNGKYASGILTNDKFIKAKQEEIMAGVYSDSRKKYHADLIKDNFIYKYDPEFCVRAGMLVNEAENKKKATFIAGALKSMADCHKINENSYAFGALLNRVYTKVELNLIANLSKNDKLNALGVALPLSRIIALEEEEFDRVIIWNVCQNEESKNKFKEGLNDLYLVTEPQELKKVEKIINNILISIINESITYDRVKEENNLSVTRKTLRRLLKR